MLTLNPIFGIKADRWFDHLSLVLERGQHYPHVFMSNEDFLIFVESNFLSFEEQNSIIAHEVLANCHLSALTALYRSKRWINAIRWSYYENDILTFSNNLRSFIESTSDYYFDFMQISSILIEQRAELEKSIIHRDEGLYIFEKLDNLSTHFLNARKLSKLSFAERITLHLNKEAEPETGPLSRNQRHIWLWTHC